MNPDRSPSRRLLLAPLVLVAMAAPALARTPDAEIAPRLTTGELKFDLSKALTQPETPPTTSAPAPAAPDAGAILADADAPRRIGYGRAGSTWLTFGAGLAYDFAEDYDSNIHAAYSVFLADELEFAVELGAWYFVQEGDDTPGVSGSMVMRWHLFHSDDFSWTVFGDIGIGLLAGFDEVPDGGQEFNFIPRAGGGFTQRLTDDGTRLMLAARWHHISNGRYTGDTNNPSRDSLMLYAAIVIPF